MSCTSCKKWLLEVAGVSIAVTHKDVKRINLVIMPPHGEVRISAPLQMMPETIKEFATSKADWIRRQILSIQSRYAQAEKIFCEFEKHSVWGEECRLRLHPDAGREHIEAANGELHIYTCGQAAKTSLQMQLTRWHCALVREAAMPLLCKWRLRAGAPQASLAVRKMKTRWGSCHVPKRRITLNSQLAERAPDCLEYVVVHELAHFSHPDHGPGFKGLMDRLLPDWRKIRQLLA